MNRPCDQGEDARNSDLCAQWKAADAARDAADWTRWGVLIGIVGTIGLFWTLFYTRAAVKAAQSATKDADTALAIARDNANAAADLARISEKTAQQRLRAYLTVEPGGINETVDGLARVPLFIENAGATPAHKMMVFSNFALIEHPRDFEPKKSGALLNGEINDAALGPGASRYVFAYLRHEFVQGHLAEIARKEWAILHFGYVTYTDIFGEVHQTNFAFYHWGEELSDVESKRCRLGNDAT